MLIDANIQIIFIKHAKEKFQILKEQGFTVKLKQVLDTLKNPDLIDPSRLPLLIAQKSVDQEHVLRVVFSKENGIN